MSQERVGERKHVVISYLPSPGHGWGSAGKDGRAEILSDLLDLPRQRLPMGNKDMT